MDDDNGGGEPVVAISQVAEIDRQARAYGWEVGRGRPLTQKMEDLSPDNPFLKENWRELFIMLGDPVEQPSGMIEHAKRELALIGEEEVTVNGYLGVIRSFAAMSHRGGSASIVIPVLNKLFQQKNLSALTDNPEEWMFHGSDIWPPKGIWQNVRNGACFSNDGGKTYYSIEEDEKPIHLSKPFVP